MTEASDGILGEARLTFTNLAVTNFLSYRRAELQFDQFVAVVGPNASGKSNLVAAIKLLREIPFHGLPTALARRGGFDQAASSKCRAPVRPCPAP